LIKTDLIALETDEYVFYLQIPVQHVDVVDVTDSQEYGLEDRFGFGF